MLLVQLFDQIADQEATLDTALASLWSHPQILHALRELFDVLLTRVDHNTIGLSSHPDVPLNVQARYTRQEILSGSGVNERVRPLTWREGVRYAAAINTDLFVFTLDKIRPRRAGSASRSWRRPAWCCAGWRWWTPPAWGWG